MSGTSTTTTRRARTPICPASRAIRATTRPGTGPPRPTTDTRSAMAAPGGVEAMTARSAFLATLVLFVASAVSSTAASGAELVTQPSVVEATTWHAVIPRALRSPAKGPFIKGHRVGLFLEAGYCLGGPKPEFDHVTVVELPRTKSRPSGAAVVTTYVRWPEYSYTPATGPDYGNWLRMSRTIFRRIHTKRPASSLRLYDGYFPT